MSLDERVAQAAARLSEAAAAHAPAALASSFGAEDMVLLDLIDELGLDVDVFTLDTGRLPEETHDLIARARSADVESVRVRFFRVGPFSLDIEVSAYLLASDWNHFLELQERLLSDVIAIVNRSGASMAMPSQTMYVDPGPESRAPASSRPTA